MLYSSVFRSCVWGLSCCPEVSQNDLAVKVCPQDGMWRMRMPKSAGFKFRKRAFPGAVPAEKPTSKSVLLENELQD